mmetsp:Transcript_67839/g.126735  ORF Transcript_67839/g.126735 Transcript_67839/m.126735 type:complete len:458 (-) Transcript_67839:56-1429(-)
MAACSPRWLPSLRGEAPKPLGQESSCLSGGAAAGDLRQKSASPRSMSVQCRGSALVMMQLQKVKAVSSQQERSYTVIVDVQGAAQAASAREAWMQLQKKYSSTGGWQNVVMDAPAESSRSESSASRWASHMRSQLSSQSTPRSARPWSQQQRELKPPPTSSGKRSRLNPERVESTAGRRQSSGADTDRSSTASSGLGLGSTSLSQHQFERQQSPPQNDHQTSGISSPMPAPLQRFISSQSGVGSRSLNTQAASEVQPAKLQARDMAQMMARSMEKCFSPEVWEACGFLHPDADPRVRANLPTYAEMAAARLHNNEAWAEVQTWESLPQRHSVRGQPEPEDVRAVVEKDLETSQLAREIGWSALDVDEVRDIFDRIAPEGILLAANGDLLAVLRLICPGIGSSEVAAFGHDLDQPAGGIDFRTFMLLLVRWLAAATPSKPAKMASCTLRRFRRMADAN